MTERRTFANPYVSGCHISGVFDDEEMNSGITIAASLPLNTMRCLGNSR